MLDPNPENLQMAGNQVTARDDSHVQTSDPRPPWFNIHIMKMPPGHFDNETRCSQSQESVVITVINSWTL